MVTMPESMSLERRRLLKAFGAEIVLTPAAEGMPGAVRKAEELVKNTPQRLHAPAVQEPGQPGDPSPDDGRGDLARHRRQGRHPGLRRRHRRHDHRLRRGAQEPQAVGADRRRRAGQLAGDHARCAATSRSSRARTRSRGSAPASSPTCSTPSIIDEVITVRDEEAFEMARRLAARRGCSAASPAAPRSSARSRSPRRPENAGKLIVVVLPDLGERYLSTPLFPE